MNKKHAPSFFVSVFIHIVAGLIVYFTYQLVLSLKKETKKEELLCMSLSTYKVCSEIKKISPTVIHKTVQKQSKVIVKKVIKSPIKKKLSATKPLIKTKKIPIFVKKEIVVEHNISISEVSKEIKTEVSPKVVSPIKSTVAKETKITKITETSEKKYMNNHIEEIAQLISENLYYPRRARKRGLVGEVLVQFSLSSDGSVHAVQIISSKHAILSRAAIKTIENLSGEFPKPQEELELRLPIVYTLSK